VRGDGGTGSLAEPRNDVDDAWREASLLDESRRNETTKWGLLSCLDDNSVTAGNGWANLPCPHEQREVPWDDLTADTNGLLLDIVEGVWASIGDLAFNLVCPAAIISQAANAHADIDLGHVGSLAVIERLNGCKKVEVLLEEIGELDEELSSVLWGLFPPWALEGFAGGLDGNIDILLGGLLDGAGYALVGGVDDLEGLAVDGLDELIVDKKAGWLLVLARSRGLERDRK